MQLSCEEKEEKMDITAGGFLNRARAPAPHLDRLYRHRLSGNNILINRLFIESGPVKSSSQCSNVFNTMGSKLVLTKNETHTVTQTLLKREESIKSEHSAGPSTRSAAPDYLLDN